MATRAARPAARRRPKHHPRDSEREILLAAEQLIREQPLREVTVAAIMSRTGLKRPAFWAHFRDLNEVIIRIAEQIAQELGAAAQRWLGGNSTSEQDLTEGLRRATLVYSEHGAVLRALADAAPGDAGVEAAYTSIIESLVDAVAARIEAEQASGTIARQLDPRETGRALIWMNERYLYHAIARDPRPEIATMVQVLSQIWLATLYGGAPQTKAGASARAGARGGSTRARTGAPGESG